MVEERKHIMKNVYPQLKEELEFEIFDMSSDTVSEEVRMDQLIPEIRQKCINKIQQNTVGPNLMVIYSFL